MQRQTTTLKPQEVVRSWYVVDATGKNLGRLATEVARVLIGKHKPTYTPNVDCGDYVIVVNASKAVLTGNKLDGKVYYNHSGYTGGLRERTAKVMLEKYPEVNPEYENEELGLKWAKLIKVKEEVAKKLEVARANKEIGLSQEAHWAMRPELAYIDNDSGTLQNS